MTIVSADPANPAIVSDLIVRDSSHLVFDSILFDYINAPEDPGWIRPFQVLDSSYITIRNSVFDGDEVPSETGSGEYGTGGGLSIQRSDFVVIESNEVFDFFSKARRLPGRQGLPAVSPSTCVTPGRRRSRPRRSRTVAFMICAIAPRPTWR